MNVSTPVVPSRGIREAESHFSQKSSTEKQEALELGKNLIDRVMVTANPCLQLLREMSMRAKHSFVFIDDCERTIICFEATDEDQEQSLYFLLHDYLRLPNSFSIEDQNNHTVEFFLKGIDSGGYEGRLHHLNICTLPHRLLNPNFNSSHPIEKAQLAYPVFPYCFAFGEHQRDLIEEDASNCVPALLEEEAAMISSHFLRVPDHMQTEISVIPYLPAMTMTQTLSTNREAISITMRSCEAFVQFPNCFFEITMDYINPDPVFSEEDLLTALKGVTSFAYFPPPLLSKVIEYTGHMPSSIFPPNLSEIVIERTRQLPQAHPIPDILFQLAGYRDLLPYHLQSFNLL
jgi:hypothetical protein